MDRELTRAELDELLPLFALDALDGEERAQIERYVARDEAARVELHSLREAVALLPPADVRAPESLWPTIEDSLGVASEHQAPPLRFAPSVLQAPHRRGRTRTRVRLAAVVLAAAAIVAIAVLGVQVVHQQHRIDGLAAQMHGDPMREQALAAQGSKDAHVIRLVAATGSSTAEIVTLADGTGYFMEHHLPPLSDGSTYQLWAKVGDPGSPRMVSLGVLGTSPGVVPFHLSAPAVMFEVTTEKTPGSVTPNDSMVLSGIVS